MFNITQEVPRNVLLTTIDGDSVSGVGKKTGHTIPHVRKVVLLMERAGLVMTKRQGRCRLIFFTPKGIQVKYLLAKIGELKC